MTPKFFPLRRISFRRAGHRTLLTALYVAMGSTFSLAQVPAPTPTPSATVKPKMAYIRFWNMLPSQPPTVLELLSADKPLATAPVCNFYAGYASVTPGAFTLTIRRAGDQNGAIKRLPVNLQPDMFVTLLVTSKDGQPTVDYIDDTIDPKALGAKRLVLRQLFPNAKVTATIGSAPASAALSYGETLALDNLTATQTSLTVQATIPGQSAKSWSMPLDLSKYSHNTLLIFPDPYGRFRPRLAPDGQSDGEAIASDRERH